MIITWQNREEGGRKKKKRKTIVVTGLCTYDILTLWEVLLLIFPIWYRHNAIFIRQTKIYNHSLVSFVSFIGDTVVHAIINLINPSSRIVRKDNFISDLENPPPPHYMIQKNVSCRISSNALPSPPWAQKNSRASSLPTLCCSVRLQCIAIINKNTEKEQEIAGKTWAYTKSNIVIKKKKRSAPKRWAGRKFQEAHMRIRCENTHRARDLPVPGSWSPTFNRARARNRNARATRRKPAKGARVRSYPIKATLTRMKGRRNDCSRGCGHCWQG